MTEWKTSGKVEIVPGKVESIGGPHRQIIHSDEVEEMPLDIWLAARRHSIANPPEGEPNDVKQIVAENLPLEREGGAGDE